MYLNAYTLGVTKVVKEMVNIIQSKNKYYDFFKWRRYYTVHSPKESKYTDNYCKFCTKVNDVMISTKKKIYKNLTYWWNPPTGEQKKQPIYSYVKTVNIHKKNPE